MLKGAAIFCSGQKRGQTGIAMQMFEGPHKLELHDDRLNQVVPFDVTVTAKQQNKHLVELGEALRKGQQ